MTDEPCEKCGQVHTRCRAHRKNIEPITPCGKYPMRGGFVCQNHGGGSKTVRAASKRRLEEAEARATAKLFGARLDVHPSEALLELVQWTAGEVMYWRAQVNQIELMKDLVWGKTKEKTGGEDYGDTHEAKPVMPYAMLIDSSNRLAKYSAEALKAGVEERRVRLAESQGNLIVEALRRIFIALNLTEEQNTIVSEVVPRELRAIAAGSQ